METHINTESKFNFFYFGWHGNLLRRPCEKGTVKDMAAKTLPCHPITEKINGGKND